MKPMNQRQKRQALYGWIKWLPVISAPVIACFFDAHISIETRAKDYKFGEISKDLRAFENELLALQAEEAQLVSLERLRETAQMLALVEPSPEQFTTIRPYESRWDAPLLLAAETPGGGAPVDEVRPLERLAPKHPRTEVLGVAAQESPLESHAGDPVATTLASLGPLVQETDLPLEPLFAEPQELEPRHVGDTMEDRSVLKQEMEYSIESLVESL